MAEQIENQPCEATSEIETESEGGVGELPNPIELNKETVGMLVVGVRSTIDVVLSLVEGYQKHERAFSHIYHQMSQKDQEERRNRNDIFRKFRHISGQLSKLSAENEKKLFKDRLSARKIRKRNKRKTSVRNECLNNSTDM